MILLTALITLAPTILSAAMAQAIPADHSPKTIENYGWTAVPHAQSTLLKDISPWNPANFTTTELKLPDSNLAKKTTEYAKAHLPEQVFNHSMRAYYYGSPTLTSQSTLLIKARCCDRTKTPPNLHPKSRNLLPNLPPP